MFASIQQWNGLFKKSQPQLMAAARCARQEIAVGLAEPLDPEKL